MKINLKRDYFVEYETDLEDSTLLDILDDIKTNKDATLTYSSGCKSGICGSCAVRVNGREVLACSSKIQDADEITPLKNLPVIRDLVVDMDTAYEFNKKSKTFLSKDVINITLNEDDEKINELQSDCILCASCYSACPVYSVNEEFKGPFSLTRIWKYVIDKREENPKEKIDIIQQNGIWNCTLCNECTYVCPQNISPKSDIEKLRMKSSQYGYMDPSFSSFGSDLSF